MKNSIQEKHYQILETLCGPSFAKCGLGHKNMRTLLIILVAVVSSIDSECCVNQALAQVESDAGKISPPIISQEPSSKEYQQDVETLRALATTEDLGGLLSAINSMERKWLPADKQTYYSILSEACGELTSNDFGFSNISRQQTAAEKYAMDALNNGALLPLGMRAYFVEHLTYVPGHGISGVTGNDWAHLRSERAELWLRTWQQISQQGKDHSSIVLVKPQMPPRKFTSQIVSNNGVVDPNKITDTAERAKYMAALKKYQNNYQLMQEQQVIGRIGENFFPLATKNIISEYSSPPYDSQELKRLLDTYVDDAATKQKILDQVAKNIAAPQK